MLSHAHGHVRNAARTLMLAIIAALVGAMALVALPSAAQAAEPATDQAATQSQEPADESQGAAADAAGNSGSEPAPDAGQPQSPVPAATPEPAPNVSTPRAEPSEDPGQDPDPVTPTPDPTPTPKPTPKPKPKPKPKPVVVNVATGPSPWKGKKLRHPRTGRVFSYNVSRWANLVSGVMKEHKIPQRYLPGILAQIQQESSGNPKAINLWDSNAAAGMPSKGLLQVIRPTYVYYAKKGYKNAYRYQTVPYTNIWAALNYVKARYGMVKFRLWMQGYNQGY